jgi:K+-transporting ATPase ATPase C chain
MKSLGQGCILLVVITLISGVLYPLGVTAIGYLIWQHKSNGSLIKEDGMFVGSELIAQRFTKPEYFWSRPSASSFNAVPSGATNLGPTSANLAKQIKERRAAISLMNKVSEADIPIDLLTSSGSGLDPHISARAARLQMNRIVLARGLDDKGQATLMKLIDDLLEGRQWGIFGEERINVFSLNLSLDRCCSHDR